MALDPKTSIVDPSTFRQTQAQATLPSAAADDSGREPVQASSIGDQLQTPATSAAAPPMQLQPSQPAVVTPAQPPSKLPGLHGFIASVLGSLAKNLAGQPATQYTTDADGRVIAAPVQPKDTPGAKLARLAGTALTGLGAGASAGGGEMVRGADGRMHSVPTSGLARALSGMGAGASAIQGKNAAEDELNRGRAKEDFKSQQDSLLRKQQFAEGNARLYALLDHIHETEADKDEDAKQGAAFATMMEEAGRPVQRVNGQTLQQRFHETPEQLLTEHKVVYTGERKVTDPTTGKPYTDPKTGGPVYERQYALIAGKDGSSWLDGDAKLDQTTLDYINKYGPYADVDFHALNAGDPINIRSIMHAHSAAVEGKKRVLAGQEKPITLLGGDDGKTPILVNSVTKEPLRDSEGNYLLANAKNEPAESAATVKEKNAKAAKDQKDAANAGNSNLTGESYLKTLPPGRQDLIHAIHEGRQTLPANRKEGLAILEQVHQAFPDDFDEANAKTWQKTKNEYMGSGKTATQVVPAYNTALEHMQDLYANTTREGIFNPFSKAYQDREVALGYVARETGKAVSAGVMTQKESEDLLNTLKGGLTPELKRERITKTAQLLHDKIEEYQTKFAAGAPSSAVKVPLLISPRAAASYDFVTNGGKTQPAPSPQTGQAQSIPPGATGKAPGSDGKMHYHDAQGRDLGVAQ